jgi:hypothetical protein
MHKNDKFIFQLKLIIHIYLIFLLIPLYSTENSQRKLDNKQIITAIFTGNGKLSTVSSSSFVKPNSAYLTSTSKIFEFGDTLNYPISINNDKIENNISLVFRNNDFDLSYLFKDLKHITLILRNKINFYIFTIFNNVYFFKRKIKKLICHFLKVNQKILLICFLIVII